MPDVHDDDLWARAMALERPCAAENAAQVLEALIEAPADALNRRESLRYFTIVFRLWELCPDVVRQRAVPVLLKIHGPPSPQMRDEISKAQLIYELHGAVAPELLLDIASDVRQDFDTRCAAATCAWKRNDLDDASALSGLTQFTRDATAAAVDGREDLCWARKGACLLHAYGKRDSDAEEVAANVLRAFGREGETLDDWTKADSVLRPLPTRASVVVQRDKPPPPL